ncbi:protein phosphatase 2C domain-containing protein [Streptomyces sp. MP131-18]|uniref:protein phosphatase 2C domain-containing protein n=1 Tax=Streptomyces sp. MP131-18 TaxID=1857892 RepID=UPI0009CCA524|nr:protein phosphatase 2C domain-containing protein [Streptomyces sp. MP131-18]ONK13194.1 hypothetical protein STBA_39570 [Streptomyces sp. MP131-18]
MISAGMSVTTGELPGASSRPTEDRIFQTPGAVIVLDGVSTVADQTPRGGWYAQLLGERLAAEFTLSPGADLREALEVAIATVADQHGLVPGASPAATVSIVRRHGDRVDALVLADSPVIAVTTNGMVSALRDDRLARLVTGLPEYAQYRARLRAGGGFDAPQHRELLLRLREHQLRHVNRDVPGAYWVAEAVPEAARQAVVRSWPAADLEDVLVMTDGVSAAVEEYGLLSWAELAQQCRTRGPEQVVRMVHDAELSDPKGLRWPRYKLSDDKAIAALAVRSVV